MVRKLVDKWARWVPIIFIILVPLLTVLSNLIFEVWIFAHVSLGGHPWYWMGGIDAVCFFMLGINISYLRSWIAELKSGPS